MKNLSQSKSYLQSNISTKRERESRKHINDISYKFNKSIIVVLIVMMTLPLYTAMAIPPVCLSLWYNSNDVDLGYPLLSRSTIEGTAVYTARLITAIYGADEWFDDLTLCNSEGYYKMHQHKQDIVEVDAINSPNVVLAENPVKNQLKLLYNLPDNTTTATIFDLDGRKLQTSILNIRQNQFLIDVSSMSCGIYLLNINNSDGYSKDVKFVISR